MKKVFITGSTGYMGSRLIKALQNMDGFRVKALVRKGSEHKLPAGCEAIVGNALDAETYQHLIPNGSIFVHLVGVAHPGPAKKNLFREIDLVSIREAVKAARQAGVSHFVYLSVSQFPSKIMREYQLVRAEGEKMLAESRLSTCVLRPWYVLGPGHWWPLLLKPVYWIGKVVPIVREKTKHFELVTISQMTNALIDAIRQHPSGIKYYEIVDILTKR